MGLVVSEGPPLASVNADEVDLVAQLRAGDERAFEALVERSHATMIAVARRYVKTREVAEEVVQETWLHVLGGLDRFEGRSALKTWILRILVNTAITRAGRESRSLPFSSLARADEQAPAVDPDRFMAPGEPFAGNWARAPGDWGALPEEDLLSRETLDVAKRAIGALPDSHRTVITMRDVAGYDAAEVCSVLQLSAGNQRVILHRARSQVRAALERHLDG